MYNDSPNNEWTELLACLETLVNKSLTSLSIALIKGVVRP